MVYVRAIQKFSLVSGSHSGQWVNDFPTKTVLALVLALWFWLEHIESPVAHLCLGVPCLALRMYSGTYRSLTAHCRLT